MEGTDLMDVPRFRRRQCHARSKQSGQRCRRYAIPGGTVCSTHGGAAPQVRRAAERRLAFAVDPAIETLSRFVESDEMVDRHPAQALAAARTILDRAGLKETDPDDTVTADTVIDLERVQALSNEELTAGLAVLRRILGDQTPTSARPAGAEKGDESDSLAGRESQTRLLADR